MKYFKLFSSTYLKAIKQCKKCGCFMPLKVNVPGAKCPVNKW